jgi:hypothetical protein
MPSGETAAGGRPGDTLMRFKKQLEIAKITDASK